MHPIYKYSNEKVLHSCFLVMAKVYQDIIAVHVTMINIYYIFIPVSFPEFFGGDGAAHFEKNSLTIWNIFAKWGIEGERQRQQWLNDSGSGNRCQNVTWTGKDTTQVKLAAGMYVGICRNRESYTIHIQTGIYIHLCVIFSRYVPQPSDERAFTSFDASNYLL